MKAKGFFLLENLMIFTLGTLLLLACIRNYSECLRTMQKKLVLEEAITVAEKIHAGQAPVTTLQIQETEHTTTVTKLIIKEVQVIYNGKVIFSLATVQ